jgi:uncharacterized membrane protein YphA (DoxX/SURF4 family)
MLVGRIKVVLGSGTIYYLALLGLCAPYIQGGVTKLLGFNDAIAEMHHFGVAPAAPLAAATIATELGGSALILLGFYRWFGALWLAGFTLVATFLANRFWEVTGLDRFMQTNSFFEHLALVGGFLLLALHDVRIREHAAARDEMRSAARQQAYTTKTTFP